VRVHTLTDYRAFVEQISRNAEERRQTDRAAFLRKLYPSETVTTVILGTASFALAILTLTATVRSLYGRSFYPLTEQRQVMVEASPGRFNGRVDQQTKNRSTGPVLVSAGTVFVPSRKCIMLALVGFMLGVTGVATSWQLKKFSWLSAVGFTLNLVTMLTVIASGTLAQLVR
jgi:hypothetical protein